MDLFEYKIKDLITIEKNRSAMVPIVQSSITASITPQNMELFVQQETQLATPQKESGELAAEAQSAQSLLDQMIQQLSIDVRP